MENFTYDDLLKLTAKYDEKSKAFIQKAYEFAYQVHGEQKRKSGELYIVHPISVACILAKDNMDCDTVCAALLHDVIEDGEFITKELLEKEFNPTVATLVEGVTKWDKSLFASKAAQNDANTRKLIMGITTDLRIILLKLADRLHNMHTLKYLPRNKQIDNALETLEIHVPLAKRIGFHTRAKELADLSFQYLNYDLYQIMQEQRQIIIEKETDVLKEMSAMIHHNLGNVGIENEVSYRIKNAYAIYEKLLGENMKPVDLVSLSGNDIKLSEIQESRIHDIRSLKIIVSDLDECYDSRDILEQEFSVVDGKRKDCIVAPKTNGYQSLHTTIYGLDGKPVQTKIRTSEMEQVSNFGLVTYWQRNRETASEQVMRDLKMKFPFYNSLIELDNNFVHDADFVHKVKEEVLATMIFPVTKNGTVVELPFGSTPVDFAYRTCPMVGYVNIIAVVNGTPVPLNYQLHSKDIVEIFPVYNHELTIGELSSCAVTSCAKRRIRSRESSK